MLLSKHMFRGSLATSQRWSGSTSTSSRRIENKPEDDSASSADVVGESDEHKEQPDGFSAVDEFNKVTLLEELTYEPDNENLPENDVRSQVDNEHSGQLDGNSDGDGFNEASPKELTYQSDNENLSENDAVSRSNNEHSRQLELESVETYFAEVPIRSYVGNSPMKKDNDIQVT